jgi:hypothetical protein
MYNNSLRATSCPYHCPVGVAASDLVWPLSQLLAKEGQIALPA